MCDSSNLFINKLNNFGTINVNEWSNVAEICENNGESFNMNNMKSVTLEAMLCVFQALMENRAAIIGDHLTTVQSIVEGLYVLIAGWRAANISHKRICSLRINNETAFSAYSRLRAEIICR